MTNAHPSVRGASTVELALGSLLFVTVLIFGIHFAEVSFLSLKVQEAQDFAIWESTGRRAHDFRHGNVANGGGGRIHRPLNDILTTAERRAERRYQQGTVTQSFTSATPVNVECGPNNAIGFSIPGLGRGASSIARDQLAELRTFYQDRPALQCRARSRLQLIRAPQRFMQEGQGYFRADHVEREFIPVCGMGRARNGRCRGEASVLLGDWSLDGPIGSEENLDVPLRPGRRAHNRAYRRMVERLWEAGGGSHGDAASRMAVILGAESRSPYDETQFQMSYRGAERGFRDGALNEPQHEWNTSGVFHEGNWANGEFTRRPPCFLGLPGCGRN